MRHFIHAATLAITLMPIAGVAQNSELRSLSEYLALPEDRRADAYALLRCIGLFQGVFVYGGANFSEEVALRVQISKEAMAFVALVMRQRRFPEMSQDDILAQMSKEIEAISDIYSDRMSQNYSLTGEAWGSDKVISSDLETCGPIAQHAVDRIDEIKGN